MYFVRFLWIFIFIFLSCASGDYKLCGGLCTAPKITQMKYVFLSSKRPREINFDKTKLIDGTRFGVGITPSAGGVPHRGVLISTLNNGYYEFKDSSTENHVNYLADCGASFNEATSLIESCRCTFINIGGPKQVSFINILHTGRVYLLETSGWSNEDPKSALTITATYLRQGNPTQLWFCIPGHTRKTLEDDTLNDDALNDDDTIDDDVEGTDAPLVGDVEGTDAPLVGVEGTDAPLAGDVEETNAPLAFDSTDGALESPTEDPVLP